MLKEAKRKMQKKHDPGQKTKFSIHKYTHGSTCDTNTENKYLHCSINTHTHWT